MATKEPTCPKSQGIFIVRIEEGSDEVGRVVERGVRGEWGVMRRGGRRRRRVEEEEGRGRRRRGYWEMRAGTSGGSIGGARGNGYKRENKERRRKGI